MLLPKLLLKVLPLRSSHMQHIRWMSFVKGSRFISIPSDSNDNTSVINNHPEFKSEINMSSKGGKYPIKRLNFDGLRTSLTMDMKIKIKNIMINKAVKKVTYIIGQDAADMVVDHLKKDLKEGDVIVEAHSGPGILTKTLLEQTTHRIFCYEPNFFFMEHLRSYLSNHEDRVELHSIDLLKFYLYHMISKRSIEDDGDDTLLWNLLKPLPVRGSQGLSPVKIVGILYNLYIFQKLTLSFTFQCCFFEEIYPVFYLYIPQELYDCLTSSRPLIKERNIRNPSQFYFNIDHLGQVPRNNFYCKSWRSKKENTYLYLVKITPKDNVHDVPLKDLSKLHYFMHRMETSRVGNTLIQEVEKWIPGCGIHFIKNGFRMFTYPRDYPPERLLEAYRIFTNLPSYKDSTFHHFCNFWAIKNGVKDIEEEDIYDMPFEVSHMGMEDLNDTDIEDLP